MKTLPLLLTLSLLAACTKEASTTPAGGNAPAKTPADAPKMGDHGAEHPLGSLTIGAHTFELIQAGAITAGKEGAIDMVFPAGKPRPGTVRAWVGVESGEGSMKSKLDKEGDRAVHGHFEVPSPIPAGSKIWIEIEENGQSLRGSAAWK
jgi:hypothetical protein